MDISMDVVMLTEESKSESESAQGTTSAHRMTADEPAQDTTSKELDSVAKASQGEYTTVPLPKAAVTVRNLSGNEILFSPSASTVAELKTAIESECGVHINLQKLLLGHQHLTDDDFLRSDAFEVLLLVDETPLFSWDVANNPDQDLITATGGDLCYSNSRWDYVNVLTQEPVRSGTHFFEMVMHKIGDEQVCGFQSSNEQAGHEHGVRRLKAWAYYCGRRTSREYHTIKDGKGALHANGRAVTEFERVKDGDVIGMLIDADAGALVFMRNGQIQGAVEVPKCPLYLGTHLDHQGDRVELRKLSVADAPPVAIEALKGPLLKAEGGPLLEGGF